MIGVRRIFRFSAANPAKRIAAESEEKARPAYEKALGRFGAVTSQHDKYRLPAAAPSGASQAFGRR